MEFPDWWAFGIYFKISDFTELGVTIWLAKSKCNYAWKKLINIIWINASLLILQPKWGHLSTDYLDDVIYHSLDKILWFGNFACLLETGFKVGLNHVFKVSWLHSHSLYYICYLKESIMNSKVPATVFYLSWPPYAIGLHFHVSRNVLKWKVENLKSTIPFIAVFYVLMLFYLSHCFEILTNF